MREASKLKGWRAGIALLAIALAVTGGVIFWSSYTTSEDRKGMRATRSEILSDIRAGSSMSAAKSSLRDKYGAELVFEERDGQSCESIFNISRGADHHGVSEVLVVVLECRGDTVREVKAEIGGIGP